MEEFCHSNHWVRHGDFTPCFEEAILFGIADIFILSCGCFLTRKLQRLPPSNHSRTQFYAAKVLISSLLAFIPVGLLVFHLSLGNAYPYRILADSVTSASWMFSIIVLGMEHTRGVAQSPVLRVWWVLSFIAHTIRLNSVILHGPIVDLYVYTVYYALNGSMMVLALIERDTSQDSVSGNDEFFKLSKDVTWRRVFALALPDICIIAFAAICMAVAATVGLIKPYFFGRVLDTERHSMIHGKADLDHAALSLLMLFGVETMFLLMEGVLFSFAADRLTFRLRKRVFQAVMLMDIEFFDEHSTQNIVSILTTDIQVVQDVFNDKIGQSIYYTIQVFGGMFFLCYISWRLTLVILAVVPAVCVGLMLNTKFVESLSQKVDNMFMNVSGIAFECISGIRTVRSFAREETAIRLCNMRWREAHVVASRLFLIRSTGTSAGLFCANASMGLVLWYGGTRVLEGEMTGGILTSFILYTLFVAFALAGSVLLVSEYMRALHSAGRLFGLLDYADGHGRSTKGWLTLTDFGGRIEFNDIHFTYKTRPDTPVLCGVDLVINTNSVLALVGPSGSGKSTICNLLQRFYGSSEGTIRIDGQDLKLLEPSWWREQVGTVSQDCVMFELSVAENIAFGCRRGATAQKIKEAAKLANAHDFIMDLPQGYETQIGERGVLLSGGQRQRISIARAVLKDPRILILDEATSALDAENETSVMEALLRLMRFRTVIMVTHRESLVQRADCVAVLHGGRIVEQGTYSSLMEQRGLYWEKLGRTHHKEEWDEDFLLADVQSSEGPFSPKSTAMDSALGTPRRSRRSSVDSPRSDISRLDAGPQSVVLQKLRYLRHCQTEEETIMGTLDMLREVEAYLGGRRVVTDGLCSVMSNFSSQRKLTDNFRSAKGHPSIQSLQ